MEEKKQMGETMRVPEGLCNCNQIRYADDSAYGGPKLCVFCQQIKNKPISKETLQVVKQNGLDPVAVVQWCEAKLAKQEVDLQKAKDHLCEEIVRRQTQLARVREAMVAEHQALEEYKNTFAVKSRFAAKLKAETAQLREQLAEKERDLQKYVHLMENDCETM